MKGCVTIPATYNVIRQEIRNKWLQRELICQATEYEQSAIVSALMQQFGVEDGHSFCASAPAVRNQQDLP